MGPSGKTCQLTPGGPQLCQYQAVWARYRINLAPDSAGAAQNYLLVTQRYEFYRDFQESQVANELECEPSKDIGVQAGLPLPPPFPNWLAAQLPDCARWKPLVSYRYVAASSGQVLSRVNAAIRLHFTPDSTAIRAAALFRDCEPRPRAQCQDAAGHLEEYNHETAMQHEVIVRGFSESASGVVSGRYDNLHQTPANDVLKPGANLNGAFPFAHLGAGCPECVHIHWRWGQDILDGRVAPYFGGGQPLVQDAEPSALPAAPNTHQQLDVAVVAYHPEELAPYDFTQLVVPGMSDAAMNAALAVHEDDSVCTGVPLVGSLCGVYTGGELPGKETLEFPSGSCSKTAEPSSWGKCGDVTWLSATSFNDSAGHESSDTLFAFGGFFCSACQIDNYSPIVSSLRPRVTEAFSGSPGDLSAIRETNSVGAGKSFHIIFSGIPAAVTITDALSMPVAGVTATVHYVEAPPPAHEPVVWQAKKCDSIASQKIVCSVPPGITSYNYIDIAATAPENTGPLTMIIHGTWGG
jgi:hypothetical protein